jgi:carbonic anhydrase
MKRRKLALLVLGATVAALAAAGWAVGATAWNHDPGSAIGPAHWETIDPAFEKCGTGTRQSPVNITRTRHGGGPALQFRYPDNELVVENTGSRITRRARS